ncbi:MAG: hypothetical protein ABMA26_10495 [Limisphaerales bacterium]
MQRKVAAPAFIALLVLALVVTEILPAPALEEIKTIRAVVDAEHVGVRRFLLAHGRFYLTRENFLSFLVVLLELDDRKQVVVEPFEVGCVPVAPVGVVVAEPVAAVKDGAIEPEDGRVALRELDFDADEIAGVEAGVD